MKTQNVNHRPTKTRRNGTICVPESREMEFPRGSGKRPPSLGITTFAICGFVLILSSGVAGWVAAPSPRPGRLTNVRLGSNSSVICSICFASLRPTHSTPSPLIVSDPNCFPVYIGLIEASSFVWNFFVLDPPPPPQAATRPRIGVEREAPHTHPLCLHAPLCLCLPGRRELNNNLPYAGASSLQA